ncbi:hypothetical protein ACHAXR_012591 [Thalassiosira sp. AJA248-18]
MSIGSPPSSISEEIAEAKKLFPSVKVLTATQSFLIATYERTPYTRIKMTLTFHDDYPSHPLIVVIDQTDTVVLGLKKKLEKELNDVAARKSEYEQFDQVRSVWEHLLSFVNSNMFIPCWRELKKELKKCVDLVQNSNKALPKTTTKAKQSSITIVSEIKGKIKVALHNEAYYYKFSITIDPAYPDYSPATGGKACLLQMQSTNFPNSIEKMLTSQAEEIVRRMQEGLSSERALKMSNPVKVPKNFHLNTEEFKQERGISNATIQNIKHDTEALKQVSGLRKHESSAVRAPGDNGYVDMKALAKERKDARRAIHKLTEAERAADLKAEEKDREWKLEEAKRLAGYYDLYNVSTGGTISPQPSLFVIVTFLVERVNGLVSQKCPCCKERVLPLNPEELNSMYGNTHHKDKEKKKMKPMRPYCGCWYHKHCLNTYLTEPPFGLECPTEHCGRRVFHPDWPGDIKQLEREWAARQARMREVEDAMMFL